jgi:small subunit ribosomal protein S27e
MKEDAPGPDPARAPRAAFFKVKCPDCSSQLVVFSRPSAIVNCNICGALLASPTGGRGKFRAEILETLS